MVTRDEVNMMGLALLRMWLVMMNRGYRVLVNVMVTREEVNMMGMVVLRVWLVMMNRGLVLQQDRGVVELDFGGVKQD